MHWVHMAWPHAQKKNGLTKPSKVKKSGSLKRSEEGKGEPPNRFPLGRGQQVYSFISQSLHCTEYVLVE